MAKVISTEQLRDKHREVLLLLGNIYAAEKRLKIVKKEVQQLKCTIKDLINSAEQSDIQTTKKDCH